MDKQIITFSANEQNLVRIGGEYHYSSNKVSYIGAHFDLGANWDGFDSVRAVWFTDRINGISTVLDGEGNCTVPTEVLKKKDRVFVNLVGSIVSNGELTDRLTTYPAAALVVDSKAKVDSTETAPVTPSQFEQFVSIVQDAVANIKDIVSTTLNADYTLTFVYSDGTSYTTPSIRGERGPQGADGADGTDGNGIASAVLNSNYTLTLTFTDGTSYTTPSIRGAQGPKGDPGDVSQAQLDAAVSDLKSNLSTDISFVRFADNILNVEWENGQFSEGQPSEGAYSQRTKKFIDLTMIGYQNIFVSHSSADLTVYIHQYDASHSYLGYLTVDASAAKSPTNPNTKYLKLMTYSTVIAQESQGSLVTVKTINSDGIDAIVDEVDLLDVVNFETNTINYADNKSKWESGFLDANGEVVSTLTFKVSDYIRVLSNSSVTFKATLYTGVYYVAFYDDNKTFIAGSAIVSSVTNNWTSPYTFGSLSIPSGAKYFRMTFRADNDTLYGEQSVTIKNSKLEELEASRHRPTIRALIIGDSYSANNDKWLAPMMEDFSNDSSYISLAVSSATIKDQSNDRVTYPYTSRPLSTNTTPNTNTFGCQIAKLKRLMEGSDLDVGETAIYQNESEYPNVIIIQGGENDWKDGSTSNYISQYEVAEENAYYSMWGSVSQGTVYLKPDIETIDRTTFAGAYRYVIEELYALFPKAQFFITTTAPCAPHRNPVVSLRREVAEQQRLCADLCCASVIDWQAESQISIITNSVTSGNGTQGNPYNVTPNTADLSDGLHPTAYGGKKLGKLAGAIISHKFMGLS